MNGNATSGHHAPRAAAPSSPPPSASYVDRRGELETYFDRTAVKSWERLTSDAPVSGIRATVRAGRDEMRALLLAWLPRDLSGRRLLDAGCGTGALAIEAARRGADVVGIDISPTLVKLAAERAPRDLAGSVRFHAGDMLGAERGAFDHVVAMDSVIHYRPDDMCDTIAALAACATPAGSSVVFTFAPRTPALMLMKRAGALFPRGDRAPAIEPIAEETLRRLVAAHPNLQDVSVARTRRVDTRFYKSQAMELSRP